MPKLSLQEKVGREGVVFINKHGESCTTIEYIGSTKVLVEWEDGSRTYKRWGDLVKLEFARPKKREGVVFKVNNGDTCTVVSYKNTYEVLVEWGCGHRSTHSWGNLVKGEAGKPLDLKFSYRIGYKGENSKGFSYEVVAYENSSNVTVLWECGERSVHGWESVEKGCLLKPSSLFLGVGVCDERYGGDRDVYCLWHEMLTRCYSDNKLACYDNVEVADELKVYSNFYKIVSNLKGFRVKGYQLDKDILSHARGLNCPTYSKETLCFVPAAINNSVTYANRKRNTELPRGIYTTGIKFYYEVTIDGVKQRGYQYDSPEEAFLEYKNIKENGIKELAEKYKGDIDVGVYAALITYSVEPY